MMARSFGNITGKARIVVDICDALLCLVLASACAYLAAGGFYVAPQVQADPLLLVAFPAVLLAALVATRRSGVAFVVGWVVFFAASALMVSWAVATSAGSTPLADEEANATLFVLTVVVCVLAVFLLSRTTAGLVVLAFAVVLDVALIEFLYRHAYTVASIVALGALVALLMFSRMRIAFEREGADRQREGGVPVANAALSAGAGAAAVLVALGLSVALVAVANPPTGTVKLFTEERALEEIEVEGIADVEEVPDENLTSDLLGPQIDSSKQGAQDSAAGGDARSNPSPTAALGSMLSSTFNMDTNSADFTAVSHEMVRRVWVAIVLLVVLAVAGLIVGKRVARRRWLAAFGQMEPDEQAVVMYRKLEQCLGLVGLARRDFETVFEYGKRSESALATLFGPSNGLPDQREDFAGLSDAFEQARYGGVSVDRSKAESFAGLYRFFPKRAARHLGRLRYALAFLRI